MANKKSLDSKAYINGQVNKFREECRKNTNEEARKQLAENFRKTISTEEYQENLKVVNEDADIIRKESKRKKWWDITSEEFKDAKTEFYGKDMSLDFWEDFEKLNLWKKMEYIFEKFWDTDYAADLMIKLLKLSEIKSAWIYDYIVNVRDNLIDWYNGGENNVRIYRWLSNKFWNSIVTARIYYYLIDRIIWDENYSYWIKWLQNLTYCEYKNLSQMTLKKIITTKNIRTLIVKYAMENERMWYEIEYLVKWCKDWEISDLWLINILKDSIRITEDVIVKLSPVCQKFLIDYKMKKFKWNFWKHSYINVKLKNCLNFWEWVDSFDFFLDLMLKNLNDKDLEYFCEWGRDPKYGTVSNYFLRNVSKKHKQIVDSFIKAWKLELVKKYISHFTWLTEEEKSEILWK